MINVADQKPFNYTLREDLIRLQRLYGVLSLKELNKKIEQADADQNANKVSYEHHKYVKIHKDLCEYRGLLKQMNLH